MNKKNLSIGDTTFLVFYKMNKDSSYSLIKEFKNIIPIYFNPNEEVPHLKNEHLVNIFECYGIPNPLNHVDIVNDSLTMIVNFDGHYYDGMVYTYTYKEKCKDWVLTSKQYYVGSDMKYLSVGLNVLLTDFSYCNQTFE
jgi:hypothetical protein